MITQERLSLQFKFGYHLMLVGMAIILSVMLATYASWGMLLLNITLIDVTLFIIFSSFTCLISGMCVSFISLLLTIILSYPE